MRRDTETVSFVVVRIVAIGLLVWAYSKHPIGYYTLLRFVVCAACAYGAYYAMKLQQTGWIWAMAFVAVLFNPLIPMLLTRAYWRVIDAMAATFLLISIPLLRRPTSLPAASKDANESSDEYHEPVQPN